MYIHDHISLISFYDHISLISFYDHISLISFYDHISLISFYDHISLIFFMIISHSFLLRMRNVPDKSCRENQNTFCD